MHYKYFLLIIALGLAIAGSAQTTAPPVDSNVIYKSQDGKLLNKEEAGELMKAKFSMKKEVVDGKTVITIIPTEETEASKFRARMQAFRENLIGKPIESFKLADLNDKNWRSKDLKGKVIVINFWFTSCEPCIHEMPLLNETVTANKDKPVVFLAPAPENAMQIQKFLKKHVFEYTIIPSATAYMDKLSIEVFPTHLVIDKTGIIRQVFIGYSEDIKTKLQQEIDKLVAGI